MVPQRAAPSAAADEDPFWPTAANDADEEHVEELARRLHSALPQRPRAPGNVRVLLGAISAVGIAAAVAAIPALGSGQAPLWQALRAPEPPAMTAARPNRLLAPASETRPAAVTASADPASDLAAGLSTLRAQMQASAERRPASEATVQDRPGPPAEPRSAAEPTPVSAVASVPATAEPVRAADPVPGPAAEEIAALLARARSLIAVGDIAAARRLAERAASGGDGRATFALAETFDPARLKAWRVRGLKADPERARALYQQAQSLGIAEAQGRLSALR